MESDRGAVPSSRTARFPGPLPEPGVPVVPAPGSPQICGSASTWCGCRIPRRGDLRPAIAVPGHRHRVGAEEGHARLADLVLAEVAFPEPRPVALGCFARIHRMTRHQEYQVR